MQFRILAADMADKPRRKRPNRLVTLDPATVTSAVRVGRRQRPPITALSRLIDVALAEWVERNDGRPVKRPKNKPDAP